MYNFFGIQKIVATKFGILLPRLIPKYKTILPKTAYMAHFWENFAIILMMEVWKFGSYTFDNFLQILRIIGIVQIVYV